MGAPAQICRIWAGGRVLNLVVRTLGVRMLDRRSLLKLGLASGPFLMGGMDPVAWSDGGVNAPKSPPVKPFQVSLPFPPTHVPVVSTDGNGNLTKGNFSLIDTAREQAPRFKDGIPTDYFIVPIEQTPVQILPGKPTLAWTYGDQFPNTGTFPGPTFKARSGFLNGVNRTVGIRNVVRFDGQLAADVLHTGVVHLHGAHTAAASDGFPAEEGTPLFGELNPGESKFYVYDNDSVDYPCTLWYHDHSLDFTGRNVYMGLAGFYLLQDETEDSLNLPGNPNDSAPAGRARFEVPLVLQDRIFDANNQFFYNSFSHDGIIGDTFLVNGAVQPFLTVSRRKYRFRVLNGSNARIYQLTLNGSSGVVPFNMIGAEGGLFQSVVKTASLLVGMAERWEFVIDFAVLPKTQTTLTLNNIMQQSNGRGPDGPDPRRPTPLVQFRIVDDGAPDATQFTTLRTDQPRRLTRTDAQVRRTFEFVRSGGAWQVNGRFFDPNRNDANVKQNNVELWTLKNGGGGWWHPIHIHLIKWQLLTRNGRTPVGVEAAPGLQKEVFLLQGGDSVDVIGQFNPDLRNPTNHLGRWVFHCHNVEHEDMRMMGAMQVTL
jgi:FtsP/CotA-like multicopper oxidase with cupredoxin domain